MESSGTFNNARNQNNRRPHSGFVLAWLLLLGGCSTVYEEKYAVAEGWWPAYVYSTDLGKVPKTPFFDCRRSHVAQQDEKFVVVYFRVGRPLRVVVAAGNTALQTGDKVYINRRDCNQLLQPRSSGY